MFLYICYHNPFGDKGGGAVASHAYFRAFCDYTNGDIDLICSHTLSGEVSKDIKCHEILFVPDRNRLQKMMSAFNGYMNRYVEFTMELLMHHKGKYEAVVFDHSNIAGPLIDVAKKLGLKTITIHHNYEREYFSDNNHGLYKLIYLRYVKKWEKMAYEKSDLNLFLTGDDMSTFRKVYKNSVGRCAVIGAFEYKDYEQPRVYMRSDKRLTFAITGSLVNHQTTDAIDYFFSDLYKFLPTNCVILIAGRNPTSIVKSLCESHTNVILIPDPKDMNEVVSQADIYICATRIGGGLKLRVMDGLKNGLPVITHRCSARGFDAFYGSNVFKIFDDERDFNDKLFELLEMYRKGEISKTKTLKIYKDNFSYAAGLNRLSTILNEK